MKRLITAETVDAEFASGARRIVAPFRDVIVTPEARSKAASLGVTIEQPSSHPQSSHGKHGHAPAVEASDNAGSCERVTDPSGLTVVRGRSVQLGKFTGAGPDRNIGLTDLITSKDGAPMTAGIMSWGRDDSFPWRLDYDEVDLVLEGTLQITIDGRMLEGRAGDVFYIPKGSRIIFGTPNRTRVFYVTYPADWSATALQRPQK